MAPSAGSVIEAIPAAFRRMARTLFQPFDVRKWFVLGFCAWLANLGEGGGGPNVNFGGGGGPAAGAATSRPSAIGSKNTWPSSYSWLRSSSSWSWPSVCSLCG